jgi:hypothetical protein
MFVLLWILFIYFENGTVIEPVESVILCVIPTNIDFATSEAIMLSREVC